ncbi:MAG: hypothetical protein U0792_07640 [Gemmataceae bacterium]
MSRTLALATFALLLPSFAFAQRPQAEPTENKVEIPADGTELFRAFLDRQGVKPVTREDVDRGRVRFTEDLIVIVLGDHSNWHLDPDPLVLARTAVNRGGAAVVAADTECSYHFRQVMVSFGRVQSPEHACLHGDVDCPFVVPITDGGRQAEPDTPTGRVFQKLTRVATNTPSYLHVNRFMGESRFALAKFPNGSTASVPRRAPWDVPDDALFAVGGDGPDLDNETPYRFLMMADHSVFINEMLIEPGTQNLELTYRVIEFLQGPQKRKRCLFIENGQVIEKFDGLRQAFAKPKPQMPMPNLWNSQEKLVDLGNKIVDEAQSRNLLNNMLNKLVRLPSLMRLLVLLATLYGMWFLMRRFFSSRKPTDIPPAPAVAGVATGPPGVFDRRQKELIRRNNIYEPVRDMVRDYFSSLGIETNPGPKMPEVVITRAVRKPESLRLALKDFWKLAYGRATGDEREPLAGTGRIFRPSAASPRGRKVVLCLDPRDGLTLWRTRSVCCVTPR